MSFHKTKLQRARKNHLCDWCGKLIKKGEEYFNHIGIFDDDFSVLKYHKKC